MAIQKKHYDIERQGQCDFFDNYRIDYQGDNSILVDNTDGVYHGNILEFKCNISNTGKVLFQAIKYLSKMRIKGESIPARIMLIDLNAAKVYVYNSADYIDDIQKVYVGASSKGNDAFSKNVNPIAEYDYMEMVDSAEVKKLLINKVANETDWYIPIDLDENCIIGWAERYYREIPKATKGDFLGDGTGKINLNGEIRDPKHFAGLINPYTEPTNEKFKYLMDCLNDRLNKKDLGAFYTPIPYCQKAAELVEMAVARVPDGNDYIILDRCAGTGNLESALYGRYDKNGDELISHCVVSTYEYYEYKVLLERIGQDVRNIIPPSEANVVYENGKVSNADAMSKDYIDNPLIKQYVDNPKCTIILFENPPFRDATSGMTGIKSGGKKQKSYVLEKMVEAKISATNEIANHFIWSAFELYMRYNTDCYILFSPLKYWKLDKLANNVILKGFIFNRAYFHASASAVGCVLYSKESDYSTDKTVFDVYDIDANNELVFIKSQNVIKATKTISDIFDKRIDTSDTMSEYACAGDGSLKIMNTKVVNVNENILGYIVGRGFGISNPNLNFSLLRTMFYDKHGFYLRKDNYQDYLPILAIKHYLMFERPWYETELICCSTDKGMSYAKDKEFIQSCFIFTMLDYYNKCCSLIYPNGSILRNELCFDTTNGDTVASADLATMTLDDEEKALLQIWDNILSEAKKTANYDNKLTYGVYQIANDLNTTHEEGSGTMKKTVYDYPNLNSYLVSLRDNLKAYYKSHITEKMFEYELLK